MVSVCCESCLALLCCDTEGGGRDVLFWSHCLCSFFPFLFAWGEDSVLSVDLTSQYCFYPYVFSLFFLFISLTLFTLYFPPLGNNVCLIHLPKSNRTSILSLLVPFLFCACHLADHVAPADVHSPSHASKQTQHSAERMDRGVENSEGGYIPWPYFTPPRQPCPCLWVSAGAPWATCPGLLYLGRMLVGVPALRWGGGPTLGFGEGAWFQNPQLLDSATHLGF